MEGRVVHAEVCPCCKGRGTIPKPISTPETPEDICNCCGGRGWVEVHDEYPCYPYPPYPWIPPHTITFQTWSPYGNNPVWITCKISYDSLNPYQQTKEGCE